MTRLQNIRSRINRRTLWLAPLAVVAVAASGCGSASGSSSANPTELIKAGNVALKSAHSVGFDVKLSLDTDGQLSSGGGAMLSGPVTVELKGHAGKDGTKPAAFDTTFSIDTSAATINGEVLSPDGKTGYVQIPALLGDGWKSFPINTSSHGQLPVGNEDSTKLSKFKGLNPADWLSNVTVTSSDGDDTVSADLDPAKIAKDVLAMMPKQATAAETKQINQLTGAVKVSHGSVSYDNSSHLPSAINGELSVTLPPALASQAQGITGFDLKVDATFSDWNEDVNVSAPSGAQPLDLTNLKMLGSGI
jgi:hypothetical protein